MNYASWAADMHCVGGIAGGRIVSRWGESVSHWVGFDKWSELEFGAWFGNINED